MATESAVTTEHSHPFSTGLDLCLVHNGSLSNHNRLRELLRREGDRRSRPTMTARSRPATSPGAWARGPACTRRWKPGIPDLDGFYTFCVGTADGFAVLRDPIACKHAVLAETDDWVAMATEYRAIARLPGADKAQIWEPAPAQVYSWGRALMIEVDLRDGGVRALNQRLHVPPPRQQRAGLPDPQPDGRPRHRRRARRCRSRS